LRLPRNLRRDRLLSLRDAPTGQTVDPCALPPLRAAHPNLAKRIMPPSGDSVGRVLTYSRIVLLWRHSAGGGQKNCEVLKHGSRLLGHDRAHDRFVQHRVIRPKAALESLRILGQATVSIGPTPIRVKCAA
jgi:hypothetical protein